MNTKGKLSVSKAIIEALKDTERMNIENGANNVFHKYFLFTAVRSKLGSMYRADDEMIGRTMRKLRAKCVIDYTHKHSGIYTFEIK